MTSSIYFNGTTNYLSVANGFHFGTGAFTVEMWVKPTVAYSSTVAGCLISGEYSGSGTTWGVSFATYQGYNGLTFAYGVWGSYTVGRYVDGYFGANGRWDHIVFQRRNNVLECYVNGTQRTLTTYNEGSTYSETANLSGNNTTKKIGAQESGGDKFTGYISNLRILNYAAYSGNFTVPDGNFVNGTGTLLLMANDITVISDKSSNNYAITNFGSTATSELNPWTDTQGMIGVISSEDFNDIGSQSLVQRWGNSNVGFRYR